jgi:hypothetical protein
VKEKEGENGKWRWDIDVVISSLDGLCVVLLASTPKS